MNVNVQGNFITISIPANEGQPSVIQLPDGYSYEQIRIIALNNIGYLIPYMQIQPFIKLTFPAVDSKSPCIIQPRILNTSQDSEIKFIIEKFGQIPDVHYFDNAFDPILITGDGKEYNVIPSDQFK